MGKILLISVWVLAALTASAQCYDGFLKKAEEKSRTGDYAGAIEILEKAKNKTGEGCMDLMPSQTQEIDRRIGIEQGKKNNAERAADKRRYDEAFQQGIPGLQSYLDNCPYRPCFRRADAQRELGRLRDAQIAEGTVTAERVKKEAEKTKAKDDDEALIKKARASQKKADYEDYVQHCPALACLYREEANTWLNTWESNHRDTIDWKTAQERDDWEGYHAYTTAHPQGKWLDRAGRKKDILKKAAAYDPSLVAFDAGTFKMGNIEVNGISIQNLADEEAHDVRLRSFSIASCELPFYIYDLFCEDTGQPKPSDNSWGRDQMPAINVSWYDVVRFCNWLSRRKGLRAYYAIEPQGNGEFRVTTNPSVDGFRLPTEAEWEYAARSGGNKCFFGTGENAASLSSINFDLDGSTDGANTTLLKNERRQPTRGRTMPIDTLKANDKGLYHMSGNVREWCWDRYAYDYSKQSKTEDNPTGHPTNNERVVKGGSWKQTALQCRISARFRHNPTVKTNFIGFRIARNR